MNTVFPQQRLSQLLHSITSNVEQHQLQWGHTCVSDLCWPNPSLCTWQKARATSSFGGIALDLHQCRQGKHMAQQLLKNARWLFPWLLWLKLQWRQWHCTDWRSPQVLEISFLLDIFWYWIFLAKFAFPLHNSNLAGCSLDTCLVQAGPTSQKTLGFPKSCKKRPLCYLNYLNSVGSPFFASSLSAGVFAPLHYCSRVHFH